MHRYDPTKNAQLSTYAWYYVKKTVNEATEYAGMYEFEKFAIEINNFQEHMADNLERCIVARGRRLPIHKITSRSNKQARIAGLEPYIKQGNIRFCRKHMQLLDQLTQFPLAKNDDGPDALEMAMQAVKEKESYFAILDWC